MKPVSSVQQLVELLKSKGISNQAVLEAIRTTPRHLFVDTTFAAHAYQDIALPIANGQTISQPFIVARMTELLLEKGPINKILEIGTGSGYQAAILAKLVQDVYSIERIENIYQQTASLIAQLGIHNVHLRFGDGNKGWTEAAPFDGIIVTAAINQVPKELLVQLADGGRMIIPIGGHQQQVLKSITRVGNDYTSRDLDPVIFVPLLSGIEKKL